MLEKTIYCLFIKFLELNSEREIVMRGIVGETSLVSFFIFETVNQKRTSVTRSARSAIGMARSGVYVS